VTIFNPKPSQALSDIDSLMLHLILTRVLGKIEGLAMHTCVCPPDRMTDSFQSLKTTIDHVMAELDPAVLSNAVRVPPNQYSWPKMASVVIEKLKTRKKVYTDPYSGERSGKKAKTDVRGPGRWYVFYFIIL
jgi:hypothetical protein